MSYRITANSLIEPNVILTANKELKKGKKKEEKKKKENT
jgi:hypothetical protein